MHSYLFGLLLCALSQADVLRPSADTTGMGPVSWAQVGDVRVTVYEPKDTKQQYEMVAIARRVGEVKPAWVWRYAPKLLRTWSWYYVRPTINRVIWFGEGWLLTAGTGECMALIAPEGYEVWRRRAFQYESETSRARWERHPQDVRQSAMVGDALVAGPFVGQDHAFVLIEQPRPVSNNYRGPSLVYALRNDGEIVGAASMPTLDVSDWASHESGITMMGGEGMAVVSVIRPPFSPAFVELAFWKSFREESRLVGINLTAATRVLGPDEKDRGLVPIQVFDLVDFRETLVKLRLPDGWTVNSAACYDGVLHV